ncbi:MAG: methylenetetrahydrofolate reductase [Lachnospiraceae bacterium]|jgi:methylenetetrahydrofolate reductase (NADPH)|nr:methylenetetrahydrofolate reductase [NAD(P)H] [Lachnospiraceae bacterium]
MKVSEILKNNEVTLSFEVFPPKTDASFADVARAAGEIAAMKPHFMSVTYGAGGNTAANTAQLAEQLQKEHDVTVLAHLTCVAASRDDVRRMLTDYRSRGIENIMALRGDIPKDGKRSEDYLYAVDLIRDIREIAGPDTFCIGGACYPEGHVECERQSEDIAHLKEKVEAGCSFLTTQMFFDNNTLYNFLYRIREAGIEVPVLPGIMPITNKKQVARSVALSGATVPQRFRTMVDRYGDDPRKMQQAGVIYAAEQIIDLIANGVNHIHVYSMNKPEIVEGILNSFSAILGR